MSDNTPDKRKKDTTMGEITPHRIPKPEQHNHQKPAAF
jgi:hypothetical protein